ncbi:MAG: creatininase family protein [Planctomycetota bacterium]|nr:creatininase family protein [Planctomycetota bacterium]
MQKRLDRMTWKEVGQLDHPKTVALLPVGAVEAHGPHLPITTDVIIANAMAESAAKELDSRGKGVLLLPPISYSSARYAAGFAGTISIQPETATAVLVDIGRALAAQGFRTLGIANAHLEPSHIGSIIKAVKTLREEGALTVLFPDVTRKPWALRLTEEFKSGACHAGQYEGSIVMAEKPEWVREEIRKSLPPNPASLSTAIREGKDTFEAAGGPEAYFGDPAKASAEEGGQTIKILGEILAEAVLAEPAD